MESLRVDAYLAADVSCNISHFVVSAIESLSAIARIESGETDGATPDIDVLASRLQTQGQRVHFSPSDNVTFLSREDEMLLSLTRNCQKLASQLSIRLGQVKSLNGVDNGDHGGSLHDGEESRQVLDSINKDLNEHYAALQWMSIFQTIRELGAKNSRLDANRTAEIEELASNVDAYFKDIQSTTSGASQKLESWLQVRAAVQKVMDYSMEQTILTTLQFWTMDRRKELISKEHENTFKWILAQEPLQDPAQPASNFPEWLCSDKSLYWISGKPGSGKSTLMKFIADSPKTLSRLQLWAKDDTLVTAGFYFWSSAKDPLQKSDTGLLRSIIFQILRQCPDLIREAYSEAWRNRQSQGFIQRLARTEPTIVELLAAFERMSAFLSTTKVKFCFFIDGLDEYDGEPTDIIRLVQALGKTNNIKTCLSSRQWTEFEDIFGKENKWKLYVHQLTKGDMKLYVEDLLARDVKLSKRNTGSGPDGSIQELVGTIVEKANGVFLWVLLVVRSLLDDLDDTDRISDMERKLAAIPNDLDAYFEKMFLDIDPYLREQTAHLFETTLNAVDKLPLLCYWFIKEHTLTDVKKMKLGSLDRKIATHQLQDMEKWLNTYSQGLLAANKTLHKNEASLDLEEHQWLFEWRVDFIHRTVADFLRTADMTRLLMKWSAEAFNVDFEICKASLATLRITPSTLPMFKEAPRVLSLFHLFMSHAKALEVKSQVDLLSECLSTLRAHNETLGEVPMMVLGPGNYWASHSSFNFAMLYHCVSYGLGDYVGIQLDAGELQFSEPPSGLLSGCFSWDTRVRMEKLTWSADTIDLLLKKGLDPNLAWGDRGFSFWQQLLTSAYSRYLKGTLTQTECDTIVLTAGHHADLKVHVEVFSARRLDASTAGDIMEKVLPREQFLGLRLIERK